MSYNTYNKDLDPLIESVLFAKICQQISFYLKVLRYFIGY